MICSSVNLDRFIVRPLNWPDSTLRWQSFRGSRQEARSYGLVYYLLFFYSLRNRPPLYNSASTLQYLDLSGECRCDGLGDSISCAPRRIVLDVSIDGRRARVRMPEDRAG